MKVRLLAALLLAASAASAATVGPVGVPLEIAPLGTLPAGPAAVLPQAIPILSLAPLAMSPVAALPQLNPILSALPAPLPLAASAPAAEPRLAPAPKPERPADFGQRIRQLSLSADKAGLQSQATAADGGSGAASRQFDLLTGERPAAEEPSEEDAAAARRAIILRNPEIPPSVTRVVEREMGLSADHPFFEHISKRGSQPRNSHTNEPLGEAYRPVNPKQAILGLFHLRQESRPYYESLRNPKTGVAATGVRGGVDTMVEDLLDKGFIQPRSAGRNYRFLNGVYMDLPSYIHEVRKYAAVDPYRTEGKDRYPMVVAFRAGNVHNPGADYQGRIVGDGGTLGQVALDKVTPEDVVSIYVQRSRIAQTVARLKGTALAHVQVFSMDILPGH